MGWDPDREFGFTHELISFSVPFPRGNGHVQNSFGLRPVTTVVEEILVEDCEHQEFNQRLLLVPKVLPCEEVNTVLIE